jgi:hypothetical protein
MKAIVSGYQREMDELVLAEVALEAHQRFGHRLDEDQLVRSALAIASEIMASRPAITDYVVEIALSSRETYRFAA